MSDPPRLSTWPSTCAEEDASVRSHATSEAHAEPSSPALRTAPARKPPTPATLRSLAIRRITPIPEGMPPGAVLSERPSRCQQQQVETRVFL